MNDLNFTECDWSLASMNEVSGDVAYVCKICGRMIGISRDTRQTVVLKAGNICLHCGYYRAGVAGVASDERTAQYETAQAA
jgi:hypothetical protein